MAEDWVSSEVRSCSSAARVGLSDREYSKPCRVSNDIRHRGPGLGEICGMGLRTGLLLFLLFLVDIIA